MIVSKNAMSVFGFFFIFLLLNSHANALPSFARQTGMPCSSCHVQSFGPNLTSVGRNFKLRGYTQTDGNNNNIIPLSGMIRGSFTHTQQGQADGAADRFGKNNNATIDEAAIFLAGRLTSKIGAFVEGTYDGVENIGVLDNTDIRYADQFDFAGQNMIFGMTANNNPTVSDLWNTTPAWGFPWSSSPLAPTQAAANLIESLRSQVIGATGYMMLNNFLYIEAGGYTSLAKNAQKGIGVFDAEQARLNGGAPYWRIALQKDWNGHYGSIGSFGLHGDVNPQRITGAGTDRYDDFGFDLTYQYLANPIHIYEFTATYLRENRNMRASSALGLADKIKSNLDTVRLRAGYTFQQTYGLNLFYNQTTGTADTFIYGFGDPISGNRTGNPNSQAFTAEASYTPFGKSSASVMGTFVNLRLAVQYVHNFKFNGNVHNYDGFGRNAVNNDTLYFNAWMAF
ncbi:cytochrome C [Nitrosomonas supralitoralis]|uniref:Cytochrome C n=1 Tax=Nitrosomonas supralitoralis TaxID=2116706 RepID=A0A2P7NRV0_9PROT|nr:cytochrome C [Nitrosomonas supralitoralis]PSJ16190.1 cytochrome C [Nitrosomonas supralitoralis]